MIDTNLLRRKVLELAMQGLLSERKETDSSSEYLYKSILENKSELIKAGIIRKDGKLEDVEAEYEIPENWMWVKFGKIITLQSGQDLSSAEYNSDNVGIPYMTGASNFCEDGSLIINRWTNNPKAYARRGDILISCKGTVGKLTILNEDEVHIARQIMGIKTYLIDVGFAKYFVESSVERIKAVSKGLIPGIERSDILGLNCPLPPVEEQRRIVKRLTEIFNILYVIDELQNSYLSDVEILKRKLIDLGIQGKLTEQLLEDGMAETLYDDIQEKKAKLIKEKKIKKENGLPEITEEEIPFEIPSNWKWVRMLEILDVRDGTHDSPQYYENGIPMITSKNLSSGQLDFANVKYVSEEDAKKINERSAVDDGDILFAMIGTIGNPVLVKKEKEFVVKNVALFKKYENTNISMKYIYWYLTREQNEFKKIVSGGLQPFISLKQFRTHIMPLPPYEEQKRIANCLEKLSKDL